MIKITELDLAPLRAENFVDEVTKVIDNKDQQIAELKQQVKAKDILIDTYMSVVGTLTNAKNLLKQLEIRDKALNLAREYMFKGMCSDDVPCVEWFIKCAEEQVDG